MTGWSRDGTEPSLWNHLLHSETWGSCGHFLGRYVVPEGLDSLAERKQGCLGLAHATQAKSLQSCLTLCHHRACSPPGFSFHGILQARVLEWVAISSSQGMAQRGTKEYKDSSRLLR